MPQHAEREAQGGILDRLERAVVRPGRLDEPFADAAEPLVVVRQHVPAFADDATQPAVIDDPDAVLGERARHLLVRVAADRFREVLDEVATAHDIQQL